MKYSGAKHGHTDIYSPGWFKEVFDIRMNFIIAGEFLQLCVFCSLVVNESLFVPSEMFVILINMPSNYSLLLLCAY